jgi:hypothetical protein
MYMQVSHMSTVEKDQQRSSRPGNKFFINFLDNASWDTTRPVPAELKNALRIEREKLTGSLQVWCNQGG